MFRKIIIIIILSTLGFKFTPVAYAYTLFSDPVSGTTGTNWNYPGWTYHNSLYGTYDLFGAHGLYYPWKDIGTQDQIIKWTYHYGNAQDILSIRCRISYDGLNTEQVTYYPNMTPTIDEGVNGLYTLRTNFLATTTGIVNGELDCIGNTLTYKENGIVKASYTMNPANIATGIAFYSSGSGDTSISNIQICDINGCDTSSSLPVPLLKQTDSNWGEQTYDSANIWNPQNDTIGRWGCALTSTAMILQYYHIDKLPDGTPLDPGSLNTWLDSQSDGYMSYRNDHGLVNWWAISRLTKLSKQQNPQFQYDALEYFQSKQKDTLLTDLKNSQPDILEEPSHFVVATGNSGSTFTINDPFYNRTDLTQGYNGTFLSLGKYIPSHTDLSYMLFLTDQNTQLALKDATGSAVGDSFLEQPLTDAYTGTPSGEPITEYLTPQPTSGIYSLTIKGSNNTPFEVKVYFYDKEGNVEGPIDVVGTFDASGSHTEKILFDNQTTANDIITSSITFNSLLTEINRLQNTGQIQKGPATALNALAKDAEKSSQKENTLPARAQLLALEGLLDVFHTRGVSDGAYNVLNFDIQYLLSTL